MWILPRRRLALLFSTLACSCLPSAILASEPTGSVWTFQARFGTPITFEPQKGCPSRAPNDASFQLAIVEFDADGALRPTGQLDAASQCVRQAGESSTGVVLVGFVHGWRHDASWDVATGKRDPHLEAFIGILGRLALREAERSAGRGGRRVVGVAFGWPGTGGLHTFSRRYATAAKIGAAPQLGTTLATLTAAARSSPAGSVVVFVGHSMGALILEKAFTGLMPTLVGMAPAAPVDLSSGCTHITGLADPAKAPDLVLLMNSAAGAATTKALTASVATRVSKRIDCEVGTSTAFRAPLFMSVTSEADRPIKILGTIGEGTAATTGDWTHDLQPATNPAEKEGMLCSPLGRNHLIDDFGQSWHCLRPPQVAPSGEVLEVRIDLPHADRPRDACHVRYVLTLVQRWRGAIVPPLWVIQAPSTLIGDHSDIFNERAASLALALIQLSGATMSLAADYAETFEKPEGPCPRR